MSKEELLAMLPEWFSRIREYPEIMAAYAYALSELDGNIEKLWDNQYIQTCDEATLSLYEKLLGIIPSGTSTLEYRRMIVLNQYSMIVPFTEGYLRDKLDEMFGADGYELSIDSATCSADMTITAAMARSKAIFLNFWFQIAPAHIEISAHEESHSEIDGEQFFGGVVMSQVENVF